LFSTFPYPKILQHHIKHLAYLTGHALVDIQVDDQMDSNTLIGAVTVTDTPGVFAWQPGALTLAVSNGYWVLIEDVDRIPFEILCALVGLLERNQLAVRQGDQVITASPTFRLIFTTSSSSKFVCPPFFLTCDPTSCGKEKLTKK